MTHSNPGCSSSSSSSSNTCRWLHFWLLLVATASALLGAEAAEMTATSTTTTTTARRNVVKHITSNDDDDDDCMVCHITKVQAIFEGVNDEKNDDDDDDDRSMYLCATTTTTTTQHYNHRGHHVELVLNQRNERVHGQAIQEGHFYACIPNAYVVQQSSSDSSRTSSSSSTSSSSRFIVLPDNAPLLLQGGRRQRRELQQEQPSSLSSSLSSLWIPPIPNTHAEMVQLRTGVKKMLVVRLVTLAGEEPDESIDEIQGAIFGTGPLAVNNSITTTTTTIPGGGGGASVVEQYQAASLGALIYQPLTGPGFETGVLQVTLDLQLAMAGIQTITDAILNATASALGLPRSSNSSASNMITRVHELAHHTVFCLPSGSLLGGSAEWTAFTYLYEPYSYFQRGRCTALSVVMHEIGHSLGFRHSGGSADAAPSGDDNNNTDNTSSSSSSTPMSSAVDNSNSSNIIVVDEEEENDDNDYSDETCYMGFSMFQKGMPRKGFNAHKNWISGWFPRERLVTVNATDLLQLASVLPSDNDPLLVLQSTETENTTFLPITTITTWDTTTTSANEAARSRTSPLLPTRKPAVAVGRLVSFVDGTKILESNDALLLQIETPRSSSSNNNNSTTTSTNDASPLRQYFYLQYNRAKGFNQDSAHPDTVTVVQANHEMEVSVLKAALSTGQAYRVAISEKDDQDESSSTAFMVVTVCSLGSNVMDDVDTLDYARVAVHVERLQQASSSSSSSSFDPCQTRDNAFGQESSSTTTTITLPQAPTPASNVAKTLAPTFVLPEVQPPPMDEDDDNSDKPPIFFPVTYPPLPSNVQNDDSDDDKSIREQLFSLDTTVGRLSIIISMMICLVIVITASLLWAFRRHIRIQKKLELERRVARAAARTSSSLSRRQVSSSSSLSSSPPRKKQSSAKSIVEDLQIVEDPTDSTAEEDLTDASDDPLCLVERGTITSPPPPPPPRRHHHRSSGSSGSRRPLTPQERRRLQLIRQQQQQYHHMQSQLPQHSPYHHHRHHSSRRSSSSSRHSSPSSSSSSSSRGLSPALSCSPPAFVDDLSMIEEDPLSLSESSNDNNSSGGSADLLEDLTDASDDPLVLSSTSSGRFGVI